jgi:hypothetical protein
MEISSEEEKKTKTSISSEKKTKTSISSNKIRQEAKASVTGLVPC